MKELYGTKEMAERLGISQAAVREYAREGQIQPITTLKTGKIKRYVFFEHSILLRSPERPRREFRKANRKLTQTMSWDV
jgi:predicted site-specific integrase-resolvase